jgi:hypothetical protein
MNRTRLYFTQEVADFGGSVTIKETPDVVASRLRIAAANDLPTIDVTTGNNRLMVIPVRLVGPVMEGS